MSEYLYDNPGILIGLLLIILGLLAKRWPKSIGLSHYMSPEDQKNVDLKGLGTHVMTGLILLGLLVMMLDILIETEEVQFFVRFVVVTAGVLALLFTTQRYDHNKDK